MFCLYSHKSSTGPKTPNTSASKVYLLNFPQSRDLCALENMVPMQTGESLDQETAPDEKHSLHPPESQVIWLVNLEWKQQLGLF